MGEGEEEMSARLEVGVINGDARVKMKIIQKNYSLCPVLCEGIGKE